MGIYSTDRELNTLVEHAYLAFLEEGISPLTESFKEINYGVSFAVALPSVKKPVSVSIYHTKKKGFSIVCRNEKVASIIRGVLVSDGEAGSDETGKGDIFGPLVVVAFCIGKKERPLLTEKIGDSKALTNEQALLFYEKIKQNYPDSYATVTVMPERYNALIADFKKKDKTLNDLLAWAHAKAIGMLVEKRSDITEIIVDSFSSKRSQQQLVMAAANGVPVRFETKGERFLSVAAASMVARGRYLKALDYLSETLLEGKLQLISGSGAPSDILLKNIVDQFGIKVAQSVSKTHFKNWDKIRQQTI
ncbi:ribonuclease HIII [bacterium]|nr:ribonuclease HIII [bacterium]